MHRLAIVSLLIPIFYFIQGCLSSHGVVPVSSDTYMIRVEDHAGIFAFNRGKMKGEALQRAKAFADSKNMDISPVEMKEHPVGILGDWAAVEYQFRLVPKGSEKGSGGKLVRPADFISENTQNININKGGSDELYDKLLKLDDLKKRGIITEDEFQTEKQKLLQGR
jgi:hypothetical protein